MPDDRIVAAVQLKDSTNAGRASKSIKKMGSLPKMWVRHMLLAQSKSSRECLVPEVGIW